MGDQGHRLLLLTKGIRMKYAIYQIELSNADINMINKGKPFLVPQYKKSVDLMLGGSKEYEPGDADWYSPVAVVEAENKGEVYEFLNLWNNDDAVTILPGRVGIKSLSVGDVIVENGRGKAYIVDRFGFAEIEFKPENEVVFNLMSGLPVVQPSNTPISCDPSSEIYWSM